MQQNQVLSPFEFAVFKLNELTPHRNLQTLAAVKKATQDPLAVAQIEQMETDIIRAYRIEKTGVRMAAAEVEITHITNAFERGLRSVRARAGASMGEECLEYFDLIGINGATAFHEISVYLKSEHEIAGETKMLPSHDFTRKWLHQMTLTYKGCMVALAERRGVKTTNLEVQDEQKHAE